MTPPLWIWVVVGVCVAVFAEGCTSPDASPDGTEETPQYVTTIPPFEDILGPVVGDRGRISVLLARGGSPHTYEPRPSDLRWSESSTALVYGAHHLDAWAAGLPAPAHVALLDLVPATYRLPMDAAPQEGEPVGSIDPHFWTNPLAVRAMLPALADTLCHFDAAGCSVYRANADAFDTDLVALDAQLREVLAPVRDVPVLLAQPFFRYFLERYGPRLVGIVEPHPAKEPTPRAIQAMIERVRQRNVKAILAQTQLSPRAARAVAEATGVPVIELDPIGGATHRTYAELLLYNARVLRDSLQ